MYYLDLIEALNKNNIRYIIIGGLALVLHGVVRLTADLDLLLDFKKDNVIKFIKTMEKLGYKPQLPEDPIKLSDIKIREKWSQQKNMKAFAFIHKKDDYKLVDIIIEEHIPFDKLYNRKQIIKAKEVGFNVIAYKDLITLKIKAAREQDLKDIEMLKELKKHEKKS